MKGLGNSLKGKLFIFIFLLVIIIIFVLANYSYKGLEERLYQEKQKQLKYLTKTALGTINHYHRLAKAGELSRPEAQKKAKKALKKFYLKPEGNRYFWLQDHTPQILIHSSRPKLVNKDLTYFQEKKNPFVQRTVKLVENKTAGFFTYSGAARKSNIKSKLSYVKSFPPWNWIVGTGIYLDDLQVLLRELRNRIITVSLLVLLAAVAVGYFLVSYITRPIEIITNQAKLLAASNLKEEFPPKLLERRDEIGSLARSFATMSDNLKELIADYQQTEAQLKKSKKNLSQTLQSIGDGVIVTDAEGSITRMNPKAETLTGWGQKEAVGKQLEKVFQISKAKTDGTVKNPVDKVLASGKINGLGNDTVLTSKDGTEYQISDSAAPIYDSTENIIGVVLVFKDITEKYRQQQMLKASEEKYRTLVTESPIGIFRTTSTGQVLSTNPALAKMLDCSNEKEVVQVYQDLSKDLYVNSNRREKFITQLRQKGKVNNFEYKALKADGGHIWLEMDARLSKKKEDGSFVIEGFVSDITDRKRAEKALQEKTEALETFFNVAPDLLCIANTEGTFIKVNQAWEEIFGYFVEHLQGSKVIEFVHPEDREKTKQALTQLKNQNQMLNFINRYQTETGDYRYLEWRAQSQDQLIYAAARDITERKQKEDKIKYISFHDNLTDLYNRTYLEEEIKRLDVERQLPISLIMADLNGLKIINDTYGHAKGDQILKQTAEILENSCRQEDIIARWGGDEFVILLPQTSKEAGQKIYERIKKLCEETETEEIPVSIALGVAVKENPEQDIYEVLNKAEEKMYKNKLDESRSTKSDIVNTLVKTLGEKSNETEAHAWRMQKLAFLMGDELNLSHAKLDKLSLLATLHDIGKTIIPAEILTKSGQLTEQEWCIIKEHPETGYRIASATQEFGHVAEEILCHHEWWDGTGYPRGLKGEEIPLLSRIISIADAYDVMTNGRSYKEAIPKEDALEELKECAGSQFDPELVDYFVKIMETSDQV